MAEAEKDEFRLDKPFWYHKWVTVRKADFCSECGKAGPKAGTTNAPKLKQCSKCKSVSYVSINSLLVLLIFLNIVQNLISYHSATFSVRQSTGRGDTRKGARSPLRLSPWSQTGNIRGCFRSSQRTFLKSMRGSYRT